MEECSLVQWTGRSFSLSQNAGTLGGRLLACGLGLGCRGAIFLLLRVLFEGECVSIIVQVLQRGGFACMRARVQAVMGAIPSVARYSSAMSLPVWPLVEPIVFISRGAYIPQLRSLSLALPLPPSFCLQDLPATFTEGELARLVAAHGAVRSLSLTPFERVALGRVTFAEKAGAAAALAALHGASVGGRPIKVVPAGVKGPATFRDATAQLEITWAVAPSLGTAQLVFAAAADASAALAFAAWNPVAQGVVSYIPGPDAGAPAAGQRAKEKGCVLRMKSLPQSVDEDAILGHFKNRFGELRRPLSAVVFRRDKDRGPSAEGAYAAASAAASAAAAAAAAAATAAAAAAAADAFSLLDLLATTASAADQTTLLAVTAAEARLLFPKPDQVVSATPFSPPGICRAGFYLKYADLATTKAAVDEWARTSAGCAILGQPVRRKLSVRCSMSVAAALFAKFEAGVRNAAAGVNSRGRVRVDVSVKPNAPNVFICFTSTEEERILTAAKNAIGEALPCQVFDHPLKRLLFTRFARMRAESLPPTGAYLHWDTSRYVFAASSRGEGPPCTGGPPAQGESPPARPLGQRDRAHSLSAAPPSPPPLSPHELPAAWCASTARPRSARLRSAPSRRSPRRSPSWPSTSPSRCRAPSSRRWEKAWRRSKRRPGSRPCSSTGCGSSRRASPPRSRRCGRSSLTSSRGPPPRWPAAWARARPTASCAFASSWTRTRCRCARGRQFGRMTSMHANILR